MMNRDRWRRIRSIVEEAVERTAAEREGFVLEATGGEPELTNEVQSLLSREKPGEFLEPPLPGAATSLVAEELDQRAIGERIGPYQLVEVLASGGMGAVYRARRADEQFDLVVAIKILSPASPSARETSRFHDERQLLARLHHPSITRLLDGGTTADGRPYLVMEFVDGVPITQYARDRRLDPCERVRLFCEVCDAVHYAHQNLVVHRDLKPDNVLITPGGRVKLLDFGISKLLERAEGHASASLPDDRHTLTRAAFMTVRYSSPEQVRGEAITTSSDVFSLGAVLYELLAERPAFAPDSADLQRIVTEICEADPQPPSSLQPALGREVDAIVLKALAREPAQRYQGADALRDDLQRYLESRPVAAHPPSRLYFLRKFLRRHRLPAGLAALLLFAVLTSAVGLSMLSVRLSQQRADAMAARLREEQARRSAEEINRYLADLLISADPLRGSRVDFSLLDLLNDATTRLTQSPPVNAAAEAALRLTLARSYLNLWMIADAEPQLIRAIDLYRSLPESEERLADALMHLGELQTWRFNYAAAVAAYRECLDVRRRIGSSDGKVVDALEGLGDALLNTGQDSAGRRALREAFDLNERRRDGDALQAAELLERLATTHAAAGRPDDAIALLDQAMARRRQQEDTVQVAEGHAAAATVHALLHEPAQAAASYQRQLDLLIAALGADDPATIQPRIYLGRILRDLDRNGGNELVAEAAEVAGKSLPDWHRTAVFARATYGVQLMSQGRLDDAEPLLLKAHDAAVRMWGPESYFLHELNQRLVELYTRWDRPDRARAFQPRPR